jgi:glycosyltransferase involved in cell wall biosynthesis
MRILQITAGAANMYCGSCLHDNAQAAELIRQGHDITLVPLYTPTRTDDVNVSQSRVFFGGISIYLQQSSSFFRKTPRFLDRLWDSPFVIRQATKGSIQTSPQKLGELTVATLKGEQGDLKKEFEKLTDWLATQPKPELVIIPYTLLISLAEPLKRALDVPICCGLQGEDLFLEGLAEPWRTECLDLIRSQTRHVDLFIATSHFYARLMSSYLDIAKDKIEVHPLGVSLKGLDQRMDKPVSKAPFHVGYFARVAPEKGLHVLAEAVAILRREFPNLRMSAAGYLPPEHQTYLKECQRMIAFDYLGELSREQKAGFLRSIDINCVPSPYADPKGLYLLESLAVGTPVASPAHGAFPELLESTGGGVLYPRSDPRDVAVALAELIRNPLRAREMGAQGADAVRRLYSIEHSASRALQTYTRLIAPATKHIAPASIAT